MTTNASSIAARTLFYLWMGIGFLMLLSPLLIVVWMSFFADEIPQLPPSGYTVRWYLEAADRPQFYTSFFFSLQIALVATALGLLVSIPATIALRRNKSGLAAVIVNILTAPLIVPTIVIGAGIYIGLITLEIVSGWRLVGSLWVLSLAHVLITIPWCVRLLLANLATVDPSVEEAAASLGATPLATITHVTLPLIWSGVVAAGLFSFVVSFGNIELSLYLVAPGNSTLPVVILQYLEWKADPTIASVSVAQIVLIAAALLIADRYVKLTKVV